MSNKDQTIAALLGILEKLSEGELCGRASSIEDPAVRRGCELAGRALDRLERQSRRDAVFLASIVENLPAMLFVKDAKDLRFVRINRAGEELLGVSRSELIGKNDYDLFPKDEADFFISRDREVLQGRALVDVPEEPVHTARNGVRLLHTRKIPIPGEDGEPAYLLGISEDITERKLAEEVLRRTEDELREREAWLNLLLQVFPGVVWSTDAELRFTAVAGARRHELGLEREVVVGSRVEEHLPRPYTEDAAPGDPLSEVHEPTLADLHSIALHGQVITYEFAHGGRNYEVRLQPLEQGRRDGVLAMALDVTERRRLEIERMEARLQQAQKLESLGLLAGGIAHDFNNLLVGILGNASLALLEVDKDSPASQHLRRIESAAERAADLTRQMLAYSGRGRFVVETVDLSDAVREMAQLLEVSIPKRIQLSLRSEDDLPAIEADVAQLRQVVMNLITNAADALGESDGQISLVTGKQLVDERFVADVELDAGELTVGWFVTLEVSDTGRGMDQATRKRMFDPFFTTRADGHGLGLAAVLGIIRGHGGAIQVRSEPGRGSNIKVWFPASASVTSQRIPTLDSFDVGPGGSVLIVDDEPAVRRFVSAALTRAGYAVQTANDGAEALARFTAQPDEYGVVILDLTMPVMDGEQAFRELRRLRPGVRVLLSSGYSEQEATGRFAGRGLAGFLQKPYRVGELVAKVQELFEADGPLDVE